MTKPYWSEMRVDNEILREIYLEELNSHKVVSRGHGVSYYNNVYVFKEKHPTEYLKELGVDLIKECETNEDLRSLHVFLGLMGILDYVKDNGEEDEKTRELIVRLEYKGIGRGIKPYVL